MQDQIYSAKELYELPQDKLVAYLNKLCHVELPPTVETMDDLKEAGVLIGRLGVLYSFLTNMKLNANLHKRRLKKDKENREAYEEALIREEIFSSFCDQVKALNSTLSRQITIKSLINQEMKML